jgi:hypothetical protein
MILLTTAANIYIHIYLYLRIGHEQAPNTKLITVGCGAYMLPLLCIKNQSKELIWDQEYYCGMQYI